MTKRPKVGKQFTDAELEETKQQMLAVSYEDIKREFLEAVAESQEKAIRKPRRMQ
jgi:hypothetical protein